ncbi:MAG: GIY-YIG nuclease family protein [Elusimicrobiaceae bacterium]|jgi:hypothetical protein|nr:GIY-YIG nuclease family protein [Elusimicrobiaceae bacterium]MBT3954838.1 GIY-YIG nuclease family protein [Elusimicrobiaceae bacterium]MBT4008415.1 GIY-YIG nuclease family protein [Elusimicrobiaceae bacterium]MBT4402943.1 GIY-YIG nuclease family protein [Elusimicrobiaceae bacterium]MBT4439879.1 GIY-YIG nuclease family protein [Elusimicrobiaceae bacterium]
MIKLSEVLSIKNLKDYKIHLAVYNGHDEPLDVFAQDKNKWDHWNAWRGKRNCFNRKYIISFMRFYHEKDVWLFGGIYEVLGRDPKKAHLYKIKLLNIGKSLIGRLKVEFSSKTQNKRLNLENIYDNIVVHEVLKEKYSGRSFPGFENIDLQFTELENIIKTQKKDWKAALKSVKGIYLIADTKTGKKYVGSAYKNDGNLWDRWRCYIETGHGWNEGLKELIKQQNQNYAKENFKFTLLEYRSIKTDNKIIIDRENYWKKALLSRDFGYNRN